MTSLYQMMKNAGGSVFVVSLLLTLFGLSAVESSSWTLLSHQGTSAPIASTDFNLFTGTVIPNRGFLVVIPEEYVTTE